MAAADMVHNIYRLLLDDKLAAAPLRSPEYALDTEENPTCEVIGTDLTMIQPFSWMPNCRFIRENSELEDWVSPHPFDYIHLRGMVACFNDVTVVMQRAFNGLAPGGWIEFQDPGFDFYQLQQSDKAETPLARWLTLVKKSAMTCGRDLTKARLYKTQLEAAGFVDVCERVIKIPVGPWAKGERAKIIGVWMANAFHSGSVDAFKQFLAAGGELSGEQIEELSAQVKSELRDVNLRWFTTMYLVYGRKPYPGEKINSEGEIE
ncbi:hypothetical protein N0V93_005931 [Gnomoniopsis smithogilvyi]|uniref:Methyltransferase n=1 Tax=Gnomoniopsis smithogilvyi TaxID=1191159 RepID=A0A9W8YTQ1_9PEZI|nr:hypothetical protein N0V93_005931 [Gnomoniopsis smithogilvyi]